jgi:putative ABC transport system permease protein
MIRSFLNIYNADLGVKKDNVLTLGLNLPPAKYPDAKARSSFYDRVKTSLEAIPGVESAAITRALPAAGSGHLPYQLEGAPEVDDQRRPTLRELTVGTDYFRTLGASVFSGREFNDFDSPSSVPVVVVNQRLASEFWPGENALGKRLRVFDGKTPGPWRNVVGVVSNIVQDTQLEISPLIYLPYRQRPEPGMEVIARTRVLPASLSTAFRRDVQALDSGLPIFGPLTLNERLEENYWTSGLDGALFLIFAAIALLLAAVGLYAVIAHSVSQRTQEIGIRMAIGATARDILKLVFTQGTLPLGIGLIIGLGASLAVTPLLKSALVGVSPVDPITLVVASVVLVLAAMLGCLIPARQAMRVDPVVALRHE